MEIYNSLNTFRVMDASSNVELLKKHKDRTDEIRGQTAEAIKNGEHFLYHATHQYGDNFIMRWTHQYILEKFCKEVGLDTSILQIDTRRLWDEELMPQPLKRIKDSSLSQAQESRHFYYSWLCNLGLPLGLDITPEEALNIPQPIKSRTEPMDKYSREEMIEKGLEIREKNKNFYPLISITQGGSKPEKRFSDEQIDILTKEVKKVSPESLVMVASDKDIKSANDVMPTFFASDKIIATDSFFAHLAAGVRVARDDRQGKLEPGDLLCLYTLGWPDVWGIPGAHIVASPAAIIHQAKGLSTIWSVMDPEDYHKLLNQTDISGIDPTDISLLLENIKEFCKS